jgi:addiction module antitoxin, RelB/DinJ family
MNKVSKTETLHIRVTPEVKKEAEILLNQMGMSTTEAINIFLNQVIINGCIPFTIRAKIPNETTQQAMYEAENGINLKKFDNAQDMFKELGI